MPWWHDHSGPHGAERYYYTDPIQRRVQYGLNGVVAEPMAFWMANNHVPILNVPQPRYIDKWDIFAEYPFLEEVDYNRLQYETYHGIKARNDAWLEQDNAAGREHWEFCCWPIGCVLNAAMGITTHMQWRRAFERQLPYWRDHR